MAQPDEDEQLRLAVAASREQARLEAMSEEELIAEAIAQSNAEEASSSKKRAQEESGPDSREAKKPRTKERSEDDDPPAPNAFELMKHNAKSLASSSRSVGSVAAQRSDRVSVSAPAISSASFVSHEGLPIDKLDGSLDLVFWKGWLKEPARSQLRKWMLEELSWHRVRLSL